MSIHHPIPELDRKGLREFGVVTGGIVAALFGLFFPWILDRAWPLWPWIVLVVLGGLGLALPNALKPVYRFWMKFGLYASKVMTPLILGIVFFGVISPMALIKRIFGRDAMARKFDSKSSTYRVQSERQPASKLENPF